MVASAVDVIEEHPVEPVTTQPAISKGGPRTLVGKKRSSLNAIQHGITSRRDILPWEDPAKYDRFVQDRLDFFEMDTAYEQDLVRELAGHEWRLRRVDNYETTAILEQAVETVIDPELKRGQPIPVFDMDPEVMEAKVRKLHPLMTELEGHRKEWASLKSGEALQFIPADKIADLDGFLDRLIVAGRSLTTLEDQDNSTSWHRIAITVKAELAVFCNEIPTGGRGSPMGCLMSTPHFQQIEQSLYQLFRAGSARLWFLQGAIPSARERSELMADVPLILATVPPEDKLAAAIRYRGHIERCIQNCLSRIETARTVKQKCKVSNIKRIA